jgi:DNA-binding NarL/FixJ family response regulator
MTFPSPRFHVVAADFTPAEIEHLDLLAKGLCDKQIAFRLNKAYDTVRDHAKAVARKTGFRNRTAAAVWWALLRAAEAKVDAGKTPANAPAVA